MPQRALASSALMRPLVVLALPGMYLLYKYNQYRQQQMETARRRVTERELAHLNHKIKHSRKKGKANLGMKVDRRSLVPLRRYAKEASSEKCECKVVNRKNFADQCKEKTAQVVKFLKCAVKLTQVDGGTNFNTPYKALECAKIKTEPSTPPCIQSCKAHRDVPLEEPCSKLIKHCPYCPPEPRPGVNVSVLNAETRTGQFLCLMLKQNPYFKMMKLFDGKSKTPNSLDVCTMQADLSTINTDCFVDSYVGSDFELDKCLQGADLVLILGSEKDWCRGAAQVKRYAEAAVRQCPRAIVVVAAEPVDKLTVVLTETFIEMGWYDPRRILGSMALPESRANALAALHLGLDPRYISVPCVGGSSGDALVPLNSKAIHYFTFTTPETERMVQKVRQTDTMGPASEAHALHKLSERIAKGLLCEDRPITSAYVANDSWQFLAPTRFLANPVRLGPHGIDKNLGVPKVNETEKALLDTALAELTSRIDEATCWYCKNSFCARNPQTCWKQPPLGQTENTDCVDPEAKCCRFME